jgi:hypothetical protein
MQDRFPMGRYFHLLYSLLYPECLEQHLVLNECWMNEWMNERMSDWLSEWMDEWVNEWMCEWVRCKSWGTCLSSLPLSPRRGLESSIGVWSTSRCGGDHVALEDLLTEHTLAGTESHTGNRWGAELSPSCNPTELTDWGSRGLLSEWPRHGSSVRLWIKGCH